MITLKDLQAMAKYDRRGLYLYGDLKIYWDDATGNFSYWFKGEFIDAEQVANILNGH